MEKVRIYELAKELNTTSKRLMEKLGEINIAVKNHMSLLEPEQLSALYKHIGIKKHDDEKRDSDDRKPAQEVHAKQENKDFKKDPKKDTKSAPRIIRTTEIIIDTKTSIKEPQIKEAPRNENRGDVRGNTWGGKRPDIVKHDTSTSGLRPGFVRDVRPDFKKDVKSVQHNDNALKQPAQKEHDNMQKLFVNKTEEKVETKQEIKLVPEKENMIEQKIEPKIEIKPEHKEEQKAAPAVHHGTETAQEAVKENNEKAKHEMRDEMKSATERKVEVPASRNDNNRQTSSTGHVSQNHNRHGDNNRNDYNRQSSSGNYHQGGQQGGYNRPHGDRPQGDRPHGDRPHGDRPQGGYNRPYGDRPQGDRPQGDRPQGGYNRPYGDRPQGDRPQGGYNRPYGDRPQGDRPQGDRPQGGYNRPYGDRPQGGYNRPYGDRPQGDRPQGDRPQGGYNRPYGDRPQGDRPQGGYNRPYGDRPQGDRPQGGGFRPHGDRPQGGGFRPGQKPLEIPKPEYTAAEKEELNVQRAEIRREFQNKDMDKDVKREQKKDVPKNQGADKSKRFKPQRVILGEKKGVSEIMSDDFILEEFYNDDGSVRKRVPKNKKNDRNAEKYIPPRAVLTSITIPETITVKELAEALKKTSTDVIKKLMGLGLMATLNQEVDFDTATIVADEFGVKAEKAIVVNEEDILFDDKDEEDEENLQPRPPVVVVMGHVDHGKTSLLDAIREANVIDSEAGGITQHIGAYMVTINNKKITFLDTPGHEAFTAMRARGAQVTDIAVLVVAADDGVMPQTIEAINHAKAANVAIIVAINKIDKPGANPDRVKQELTEYGIVAEEWGGDAIMVPVSAKQRMNIDHLLEMILLSADLQELKANPDKQAKGTIIEARLDKSRGPLATVLVQRGTLSVGDSIVTGTTVGRIRAMVDDKGHHVKKAGPSTPVEILGMPDVPEAGEIFYAITDEKVAKQLAEKRKMKLREQQLKSSSRVTLDDLFTQIKSGKVKDLNIIVKADVQGSVEAVKQSLEKLSNDEVRVRIVHGGVGAITESDVTLAQVSNAIIIAFNVRPGTNVADAAQNAGVDLRLYRVIYNAIEDVQAAMKGMLEPTYKEVIQGHAEIRQIIKVSGIGTIGGSYVTDGKIIRNSDVRVVRGGIVVHEGKLASLKRFKDDAKEVAYGYECGLSIEKFNDIKEGDIIESYIMEEVAR